MSRERPMRGGCACGRNTYIIEVPPNDAEVAQVIFDKTNAHRRAQGSPLSAWLRVPLSWYHSTTYAYFDDETHSSIRRVYTSPEEQYSMRHFCGFCGTHLSYWSELPPSEAEFISLTLGSLTAEDLRDLEDLGLLPKEALDDVNEAESTGTIIPQDQTGTPQTREGIPWFETMIEGSNLGKIKRSRGHGHTSDGRLKVEWEVVEWTGDGDGDELEIPSTSKRKLADVKNEDAVMQ